MLTSGPNITATEDISKHIPLKHRIVRMKDFLLKRENSSEKAKCCTTSSEWIMSILIHSMAYVFVSREITFNLLLTRDP